MTTMQLESAAIVGLRDTQVPVLLETLSLLLLVGQEPAHSSRPSLPPEQLAPPPAWPKGFKNEKKGSVCKGPFQRVRDEAVLGSHGSINSTASS
jgi:hypothetical protein